MPNYRNTTSGTITANAGYVEIDFREHANGGIGAQITGTWTGTITWQVSIDGTTFTSTVATPVATGTDATTTTANGIFRFEAVGIKKARATATAWTSGTAVVTMVGAIG
jgi:hypothetical protein